jgi:glycosyltransferase involved in cell wall biosynthesis
MITPLIILTVVIAILQLIWLLLEYFSLADNFAAKQNTEGVSICIAARNELDNLKNLIRCLKTQEYPGEWEVIITLDRTNDGSQRFLEGQSGEFQNLHFLEQDESDIPDKESPKKHALLKAIHQSKYPLILQTDADCIPAGNFWLQKMANAASDKNFILGLSPYAKRSGLLNQLIQFDTAWTAASMIRLAKWGLPYMSLGRNQLFRKSDFLDNGAYGKGIRYAYGDDDLLIQHLNPGKSCGFCVTKDGRTVSIPETKWSDWLRQKLRHTLAGKQYHSIVTGLLSVNYMSILFWVLMIASVLISPQSAEEVLLVFLIRSLFFSVLFYLLAQRTGSIVKWWLLPILDLLHSFALIYNGFRALFTTKAEWH